MAAAVGILREEGLRKVTMRRLAQELDTGASSLYVYVRNTAELHAAILDELLGTIAPPPSEGGWRDRLEHRWDRVPGVTLLGDAAHLMSPFAGEGANLAMLDGAELGLALAAHPGDVEAALSVYEKALFPRSEALAAESAESLVLCFAEDSPKPLLERFASYR